MASCLWRQSTAQHSTGWLVCVCVGGCVGTWVGAMQQQQQQQHCAHDDDNDDRRDVAALQGVHTTQQVRVGSQVARHHQQDSKSWQTAVGLLCCTSQTAAPPLPCGPYGCCPLGANSGGKSPGGD
jgi:hypothetical protein